MERLIKKHGPYLVTGHYYGTDISRPTKKDKEFSSLNVREKMIPWSNEMLTYAELLLVFISEHFNFFTISNEVFMEYYIKSLKSDSLIVG